MFAPAQRDLYDESATCHLGYRLPNCTDVAHADLCMPLPLDGSGESETRTDIKTAKPGICCWGLSVGKDMRTTGRQVGICYQAIHYSPLTFSDGKRSCIVLVTRPTSNRRGVRHDAAYWPHVKQSYT